MSKIKKMERRNTKRKVKKIIKLKQTIKIRRRVINKKKEQVKVTRKITHKAKELTIKKVERRIDSKQDHVNGLIHKKDLGLLQQMTEVKKFLYTILKLLHKDFVVY
jgi:hypothetical protein